MHFLSSVALLSIVGSTFAAPATTTSAICKLLSSAAKASPDKLKSVTPFCSSFLSISTRTATITLTNSTTVTVSSTATAPAVTVTLPQSTSTTTIKTTTTDAVTVFVTATTGRGTSTFTETVTSTTATSVNRCVRAAKRDLEERGKEQCPTPGAMQGQKSSVISAGCSCFSLPTPTVTRTAYAVTTISRTSITTITNVVTATPNPDIRIDYQVITTQSPITSTFTSYTTVSTTTTVTITTTSTNVNNICTPGPQDSKIFRVILYKSDGSSEGEQSGGIPQYGIKEFDSGGDKAPILKFDRGSVRLYDSRSDLFTPANSVPANVFFYVGDSVLGGFGYFGSQDYINQSGYYNLPCVYRSEFGFGYYLRCYNSNGQEFSTVLNNGLLYFYIGDAPAGSRGIDLRIEDLSRYGITSK